ncbi:MAG: SRPBCC family protein [Gemmatimonadota bacterium]
MTDQSALRPARSFDPLSVAAGLTGGLILATRPQRGSARVASTLLGWLLIGVAARKPIERAVRKAGTRRRSASLRFSFVVGRPVEQVFAFCADFENFPRFIGSLREVRDNSDGRSHWCASTPSGGEIEWDAVTTKFVTNSVIGWRSVPGSPVITSGIMRFSPEDGQTCVSVAIDYRVTDGSLMDAIAALVIPRGRHSLEGDFRRFADVIPEREAARIEEQLPAITDPTSTPLALSP